MNDQSPIQPRSLVNSDAERARLQLRQGERRVWEFDSGNSTGWFEARRRAFLQRRYPIESSGSPEQAILDEIWTQLVQAVNSLSGQERSNLDTGAIGGVVPVHSMSSGHVASIRRFPDGSSLLLISHQFITIALTLSTLAKFQLSGVALRLAHGQFGAPVISGASPESYAKWARSAVVRDLLIQLNFHGIVASYRPRLTITSSQLFRSAITYAMAHEAAHLLIGGRDSLEAHHSTHLRPDGTVAESQWGREASQDRLALRLSRLVGAKQFGARAASATVDDRVLSSAVISLVTLHVLESGYFLGEADSHPKAIDRLGSLMVEFNPLASPMAFDSIERLLQVVDTCLFLEPLPEAAWILLVSLIRSRVLRANERRRDVGRIVESAKASDIVLTARAEYAYTYEYLISNRSTEIADGRCLDLLLSGGRDALPEVLDLFGIHREEILCNSTSLTRRDVAQIIDSSPRIHIPSGIDRRTYVDTWANVICAVVREIPHRDRIFYHLLGLGEET